MTTLNQFHLDRRNRGPQSLRDRCPAKCEPAGTGHVAAMCEAEKVERFGSAFSACLAVSVRSATEFDQACLIFVKLQTELRESLPEFVQTTLRFVFAFKADHKVISVSNYDDFAACPSLSPHAYPQIENVVQEHVGKQRRDHRSLWRAHFRFRPFSIVADSGAKPFVDQTKNPLVRDAVLQNFINQSWSMLSKKPSTSASNTQFTLRSAMP